LPCSISPAIHHSELISVSEPMRAPTASTRPQVTSRSANSAYATHMAGPTSTSNSEVALIPPTVRVISANAAGSRQPPRRRARMVNPISQGSPANGNRMIEMRAP